MKILLVHNDYQIAGGETAVYSSEKELLQKAGHHVIPYFKDNKEINDYSFFQKVSMLMGVIYSAKTYREIRAIASREKPDVAHVHNVFPLISPSVYLALRDAGIPCVQTVHNWRFLCPNGLFYTHEAVCERCKYGNMVSAVRLKCYRDSYPLSAVYASSIGWHRDQGTFAGITRFIVLTEFTANKLVEAGFTTPEKISILGNFLPSAITAPEFHKNEAGYVAYLGRLSPEKGIPQILSAAGKTPQIQFKIAGSGPEQQKLVESMSQRQLHNVVLTGPIFGEEKWSFLKNSLCSIVPSMWYEQFGLSIIESMACGTPVIGSRIGGIPKIIDDQNTGLLFMPGDADDLAMKINQIRSNRGEAENMARRAYKHFFANYTEKIHLEKLTSIYQDAITPHQDN